MPRASRADVRSYTRRTRSQVVKMIETGEEDLSKWTVKELLEGWPTGRKGQAPMNIPIAVHQELARRVISTAQFRFIAELQYAVSVHMEILKNPEAGDRTRLDAVKLLYERVLGAPDQKVDMHVTVDAPWQKMMAEAVVSEKELTTRKQKALPTKGVKRRASSSDDEVCAPNGRDAAGQR